MPLSQLIVNADDFGFSKPVNRAIFEVMESGLVNSTSMIANMPGFDDAVELVREQPLLGGTIGLHLNLTEGHPLSRPILDCPAFCNDNGSFVYPRPPQFRLSRQEKQAAYTEMQAQLQRLLDAGIQPTHLDSHHHIHTEWAIAPLVCRLARQYDIHRIRLSRNLGDPPPLSRRIYKALINKWRFGAGQGFHNTDYFGGIEDMRDPGLERSLEGKSVEIIVHPLYNEEGELVDLDRGNLCQRLWSIVEKHPAHRPRNQPQ